jgi:putative DNA primase/helicase
MSAAVQDLLDRPLDASPGNHSEEVTRVTRVQPNECAASGRYPDDLSEVTEVTPTEGDEPVSGEATDANPIPGAEHRPCFRVFEAWVEAGGKKYRPGVWSFGVKASKKPDDPPTLTSQWVCSPLHIEAVTLDGSDASYGRLLAYQNTSGRWHDWAMPMEMLRGAGDDLRGELLHRGVELDPQGGRVPLMNYLQSVHPKRRMRCASQVGWCNGSFVLPDKVIGPAAADVIFQSEARNRDEFAVGGNAQAWRDRVAGMAAGNPLLMLALSVAFSGPLMALVHAESGGVHIVGDTSTGKTTAAEAACSVWGGPGYKRSWRATANGLEGAAVMFNDSLLCLDEISECDPRDIGAIVYSLGNGQGKQRAERSGAARGVARWRCAVLSTGERTVATAMAEGGHRAKAGQGVRILDIPAARRYGAFDTLHGLASGATLSDAIKTAAATHFGHAGRAFLERLTLDTQDHPAYLERIKRLLVFAPDDPDGLVRRAAARFALFALAGELATEYGLTGWTEGAAIKAAAECFAAWRGARGSGNAERRQFADAVLSFIERHGDGRFSDADATNEAIQVRDRAGWWRGSGDTRQYLFTSDGLREAAKGFDFKAALDKLTQCGALPEPGADGKRTSVVRVSGRVSRLYPINIEKLGATDGTR